MTLNCARCHDHKIDPIPQADYYKLVAFFRDVRPYSNDPNAISSSSLTDIDADRRKRSSTRPTSPPGRTRSPN